MDPGDLVGEMLAAPAALAYLDIARASGLPPEQAADPLTALFLAAAAVDLVGPWRGDREEVGEHLAAARDELAAYARAVAAEEALSDAWFAPLDRQRQVWIEGRAREGPGAPEGSAIVTVDWSSVAGRWDGVHLTVGGLLLAERRLVERDGLRTAHSAWDVEQTLWLRWVFGAPEPFQPVFAPGPELRLPEWYWRRLP